MSKATAIKAAIAAFEKEKGVVAAESLKVDLSAQVPPIEKLDATLNVLKACRHLTLSTNNIEKVAHLGGLTNLEIISLARNQIKKLEGFDPLAETLQELWMSYNLLEKLSGLEKLGALRVLYLSNNKVKDWPEVERLLACGSLAELVLMGNPLVPAPGTDEYRYEVLKRLPGLKKLDGVQVTQEERDAARDGTGPPRPASAGVAVRSSMVRSSMIKQS